MRVKAIITARIASTRLEHKMLMELHGRPILAHVITRTLSFPGIESPSDIVLATPDSIENNQVAEMGNFLGTLIFRGSENDVLGRIIGAAEMSGAEAIYRVTGDSPLIDPGVVTETYNQFITSECDYSVMEDTPLGTTAEIVTLDALNRARDIAVKSGDPKYSEHPTLSLYENNNQFNMNLIGAPEKWRRPDWRFTVDTIQDYKLIDSIMSELGIDSTLDEIVPFIDSNPEILKINSNINQQGWESLKEKKDVIRHV